MQTSEPKPPSSRKWRIAFLRRRFSATGGAERYLLRLASGLLAEGHHLTLYCEEWTPRESPFQSVKIVASKDPKSYSDKITAIPLRDRHDVVFSLERVPGCDIYRAGDGVHADWLEHRCRYGPMFGWLRTYLRKKNREVCELEAKMFDPKVTQRVICNSNFIAQQITERFQYPTEQISLVRNGVPYRQFSQGDRRLGRQALKLRDNELVVLLVGAGKERKGHDFARSMVAQSEVKNARLVIIDRPPGVAMPHVYAAADIFLLPTLYDPFANVTLEALAAGLPVITTAQNGASEIIRPNENGFVLAEPNAISAGAQLIRELQDPTYRRKFTAPAQTLAQQYDLSRNIRETLAVFEHVKQ